MSRILSGTTTAFPLTLDVAVWFVPTANPAESLALLVLETVACAWGCSTQAPLASGSNGLPFHLEVVMMSVSYEEEEEEDEGMVMFLPCN